MPTHAAAVLPAPYRPLEVREAPAVAPGDDQVVVRARAVAVNPLEWVIQVAGPLAYRWLRYPTTIGSDVAGEVVEVGAGVTRLRVGDRVLAHAVGTDRDSGRAAEGAFQERVVVLERMASPIPDDLAFEEAAVLPLGLSTAACALFQDDQLALRPPTADATPTGEVVLVWGGATSVGSNAIQLARAAGYDVVTTCSPRNDAYVRRLGAERSVDYNAPDAVAQLVAALRGRTVVGAVALGATSADACAEVLATTQGDVRRVLALCSTAVPLDDLTTESGRLARGRTFARLGAATVRQQVGLRRRGIRAKFVFGTSLKANDVSRAIYRDFLPAALAEGRYVAAPPARVVGDGLGEVQRALDLQRAGVSAAKLVVTVP